MQVTWNSIQKGELDRDKMDRGVKYCQVIACVKNVKESYHNLSIVVEKLKVCSCFKFISYLFKMAILVIE